jgi:hypothetical protein
LFLILLQALPLQLAPDLARADEYSDTCDGDAPKGTEAQKDEYCQSAKLAKEGAATNDTLWKVWAGVAGLCVAACAATYAGQAYADYVCMAGNLAGGVTDAVKTQEYMGLATTAVGLGVQGAMKSGLAGKMFGNGASKAATAGTQPAGQAAGQSAGQAGGQAGGQAASSNGNMSSCLAGAAAGVQSFAKNQAKQDQEQAMKDNLDAANSLEAIESNSPVFAPMESPLPFGDDPSKLAGNGTNPINGGAAGSNPNKTGDAALPPGTRDASGGSPSGGSLNLLSSQSGYNGAPAGGANSNPCARSDAQSQLSCAIASDRTLPPGVRDPRFQKDLEKLLGTSLDNYLKNAQSPSQALGAMLGGGLDAAGKAKLEETLAQLQEKMAPDDDGPAYAGGGGGGGGASAADDGGIGALMAGLTSQFGPKDEGGGAGGDLLKFGESLAAGRDPAGMSEEDRSLSIFTRISGRYRLLAKRMSASRQQ